jgi:LEA14-like dessication related protein
MTVRISLDDIKRAVHQLPESDRAMLRTYLVSVFDVRGRDTRVNLLPDERDRPRAR